MELEGSLPADGPYLCQMTFPNERLVHDSGRNLVSVEYGYPKGSSNTNS
jgi:hypothetical protein